MSPERYLSPEQKVSHIEQVVEQFPEVAGLQVYEYFRSNANKQKDSFINGTVTELQLEYPDLTLEKVVAVKEPMLGALKALMPGEQSAKSNALYWAVEYRYAELFLMDMARVMTSPSCSESDRKIAQNHFREASEALYGKPEPAIFNALARKSIVPNIVSNVHDSAEVSALRLELQALIGEIDESTYKPTVPSEETVSRINSLIHERFDGLVSHIDDEIEYNTDAMTTVLAITIHKLNADKLGWTVKVVPNSSTLAVSGHQKLVEVGENRPVIKGTDLRGKVIHEVGVHALRGINAYRAGWLSAAYGQEGYLDFEESLATALEDAYKGKFREHGEPYYLTAGLAYGLDNHEPRNFREVFDIMWRNIALKNVKNGELTEEQVKKAKSSAFTSCLRLFRGTDTRQKGLVYLKDLAYFNGQERAWGFLGQVQNQTDFDVAFAGKLDLTRPAHVGIAEQIMQAGI